MVVLFILILVVYARVIIWIWYKCGSDQSMNSVMFPLPVFVQGNSYVPII